MVRAIVAVAISLTSSLLSASVVRSAEAPARTPTELKAAIGKTLPLLLKGAQGHMAQKTCFACHNQGIPILAFTTARERGFSVRDEDLKKHLAFIAKFLDGNREKYRQGKGQGGQVDTAAYALLTLEIGGWKADATTDAVVEYLLVRDKERDHWRTTSKRPPSEGSDFTPTYLAIRALRTWGKAAQKDNINKRIAVVRGWLLKAPPKDTEDRVFRLWGLQVAGAEDKVLRPAVEQLVRSQRKDGGWSQTDTMESDTYATGTVLVALHQAGGLATSDPVYQRGVSFLLKTQQKDGSWLVHTHSSPVQTYYESGFPHGKDQFISMSGTAWATTALALACPPSVKPVGQARKTP